MADADLVGTVHTHTTVSTTGRTQIFKARNRGIIPVHVAVELGGTKSTTLDIVLSLRHTPVAATNAHFATVAADVALGWTGRIDVPAGATLWAQATGGSPSFTVAAVGS